MTGKVERGTRRGTQAQAQGRKQEAGSNAEGRTRGQEGARTYGGETARYRYSRVVLIMLTMVVAMEGKPLEVKRRELGGMYLHRPYLCLLPAMARPGTCLSDEGTPFPRPHFILSHIIHIAST